MLCNIYLNKLLQKSTYRSKCEDWKRKTHMKRLPQIFGVLELQPQITSRTETTETKVNDP